MGNEKLVPKLRFVGFDDEWEEKSLGDILVRRKKQQKISKDVPLLAFAAGQGVIDRSERKTNNRDFLTKDSENKSYLLTEYNDIVYNPSNLKYGAIDRNTHGKGVISPIYVTFVSNVFPPFMEHVVKSYNFKQKALKYEEGTVTKRQSVHPKDLVKIKINIPKTEQERIKIGTFLSLIDKKTELLRKKCKEYQNFKKYLMQQIFAQKLRFSIESSYSSYKLKDIVTKFSTGLNPRKNFKLNEGGENFYVTIKNFHNGLLSLDEKCDKIDDNALKLINKRSDLQKDDLIFASIGRVGEVYLIKSKPVNWNINESVFSLRPNKRFIEPKFLYYILNSNKIQNYFKSNITGSTFKSIKMKDLKNTPVTIPDSFELQNEIIQFLTSLDSKILLINDELNNIVNFKKGLIQQMFV